MNTSLENLTGSLLSVCILVITIMVVVWIIKCCKINRRSDSQLSVRPGTTLSNDGKFDYFLKWLTCTVTNFITDVAIHLHKCEAYETVNRPPTARSQRVSTLQ